MSGDTHTAWLVRGVGIPVRHDWSVSGDTCTAWLVSEWGYLYSMAGQGSAVFALCRRANSSTYASVQFMDLSTLSIKFTASPMKLSGFDDIRTLYSPGQPCTAA